MNTRTKEIAIVVCKRLLSILFIFCLVTVTAAGSLFDEPAFAASKKKTKLSNKKVTLTVGQTKTIKLKNARKKVKWTSGNKKIVKISKVKGKKKSTVVIKAKKAGKTYIKAKVGKKTYKCKITVKNAGSFSYPEESQTPDRQIITRPLSSSSVDMAAGIKRDIALNRAASDQFIKSSADFSLELLKKANAAGSSASGSNILISPDSVLTALAMLENGAAGDTLAEMESVMSGGISAADFNLYLASMNSRLCSSQNVIWNQANSIWSRKGAIKVKDDFVSKNKKYHDASYFIAPFDSQTVTDMNNWVFNNTRNMIDKIADRLSPEEVMVLINTVAFEGKWASTFGTPSSGTFTTAAGQKQTVPMLRETSGMDYLELKGGKGFVKKYTGGDIAFVGFLPPAGTGIDSYIDSISGSDFIAAWNGRKSRHVRIMMPKFSYDYSVRMSKILQDMGIRKAFTDEADLSGMYEANAGDPHVYVDEVLHKTHIEVDENGTKAAAVTAIFAKAGSAYIDNVAEVILDRPFLYAIVDTKTGLPLFIGAVRTAK